METYILALDQGTTSCRALLFDRKGSLVATAQKEFTQHFPKPGWVEHDAEEIWEVQREMARQALEVNGIRPEQIRGIGITNQRETTVVWDRRTGKPVHNAIVWQDKRTAGYCEAQKKEGHQEFIRAKTGLVLDSYFSGTKARWILENVPDAREKAQAGHLLMGTIDSWLIWKMTDGALHITDTTNASRTLLFNIHTLGWDPELLEHFQVPASMMPEVRESSEVYGECSASFLGKPIPIAGIAGDQQAALFGQMCTRKGMVKNTYGTGCFMLMNIGSEPILSRNNLLTSVGWTLGGKTTYVLEGSIFIAGAVVQWLRDGLGLIDTSEAVEALAAQVPDTGGVYLVPAFAGLGAPYWDQQARGCVFGLTRGTTDAHLARAALESIAFQTMDVLKAMEADSGIAIRELRVDGGATVNNLLMQFQADVLQARTIRPRVVETTVMGAAFLAGLAVGFWANTEEISRIWETDRTFEPQADPAFIQDKIQGWQQAVNALQAWSTNQPQTP
ncbi:glycerol kinase GlpK [Robiginitalea sp. M366]|uniref:glycerol kinase GlpK n=1 Tax=Robiginitalea aestuariiviva TaxID=3036903 RepID=UPI00240E3835|nr:glycerol kinase GlpK [Robiginitalea aestuariiviva]MDG1571830.1 glycerol kinase GlpK [Robiginitalea aestuariiviva]